MKANKTIMERWAQAKRSFNEECARLSACLLEAEGIVKAGCGQSLLVSASRHYDGIPSGLNLEWCRINCTGCYMLRVLIGDGNPGEDQLEPNDTVYDVYETPIDNPRDYPVAQHWRGTVVGVEAHVEELKAITTASILAQWEAYSSPPEPAAP